MNVLAEEVKRRYGDHILAFSLNPGSQFFESPPSIANLIKRILPVDIRTTLTRYIHENEWKIASLFVALIEKYLCYDTDMGAINRELDLLLKKSLANRGHEELYAATSQDLEDSNGAYIAPWARVTVPNRKECRDEELGKKLWDWLERECAM